MLGLFCSSFVSCLKVLDVLAVLILHLAHDKIYNVHCFSEGRYDCRVGLSTLEVYYYLIGPV